jgi:hypothetical protein
MPSNRFISLLQKVVYLYWTKRHLFNMVFLVTLFIPGASNGCIRTLKPGNTKGGSITVPLTSCLISLDDSVLQIKTKIVSCHIADSKPVKQEVNGTVILSTLVFPART